MESLPPWVLDGPRVAAAVPSFVGPLDGLPAPLAAYSFRRLLSAYAANKAVNIRRSSDSAAQDFGFDASGNFDSAGAAAFIGGGSGFIATWYDQSGNGLDLTQGTAGAQPNALLPSALVNSQPAAGFTSSALRLIAASIPSTAPPFTLMAVAARTAAFTSFSFILGMTSATPVMDFSNATNTVRFTAGTARTIGASDSVAHCLAASINGASSRWCVDGAASAFAGTPGTNSLTGLGVGAYSAGGNPLTGVIPEALLFASALSDGNMQTIQANQKTCYGTP